MNAGKRLLNILLATVIWGGLLYLVATKKIKSPTEILEKIQIFQAYKEPPKPPPPKPKEDLPPPPPPPKEAPRAVPPAPIDMAPVVVPVAPPPPPPPPPCQAQGPSIKKGFNTERAYPDLAVRRGIEGKVTVKYTVGPDGLVGSVEVISADPPGYFEKAVEQEFRKMRWNPAKDDNCNPTTSGTQTQNVVFRLG